MIKKLKKRFTFIAVGAVAAILLFLCILLNIGNRFYIEREAAYLLTIICDNEGTIPPDIGKNTSEEPNHAKQPNQKNLTPPDRPFGQENLTPPQKPSGQKNLTSPEKLSDYNDPQNSSKQPLAGNKPENEKNPEQRERSDRYTEETPFATRYFTIRYDEKGNVLKTDLGNIAAVTVDELDGFVAEALQTGEGYGRAGDYRYLVQKIGSDKYMAVFLDCHEELRDADNLIWISAIMAVFCIFLVYVVFSLISGRAIRPYEKTLTMQKQFITDAGHELKTPLTVLSTNLSVLEMEIGKQKWIDSARHQVKKMTELVNALVSISRMDEENPPVNKAEFDLSSTVTETAELYRIAIEKAGHPFAEHIEEGIVYFGDEDLLSRLVSILLDNAMRYASGEGEVRLNLVRKGHQINLECANPCKEMSKEEAEHLFERFYRGDKARSTKGFGIGLSYARSIVEAHGGKLAAATKDGQIVFLAVL